MRRRLIIGAVAALMVAASGVFVASRGGDDRNADGPTAPGLDARTVNAGEIEIKIQPHQLDAQGAVFGVALDTHSTELSMDLDSAQLQVDGTTWPITGWDGDGPGGHHREGELRFEPAGAITGTARLTLDGFGEPVEVDWQAIGAVQNPDTGAAR
jgi:hypothetical protein